VKFLLSSVAVGGSVLLFGLVLVGTAMADGGDSRQVIQLQDRCDPVTFNGAVPPIFCSSRSRGGVTLNQLLGFIGARPADALRERNALGWRFEPDEIDVKVGTTLVATNVGGEVHTFSEVTETGFVNSCAPPVVPFFDKLLPAPTAAQCATLQPGPGSTLVFPAGFPGNPPTTLKVLESDKGRELYQCLIHPWMRLTVQVESGD
jgi:hypothetical protein